MLHNFQCLILPTYANGEFMNFQKLLNSSAFFSAILEAAVTRLPADYAQEVMRERMF